MLKIGTKTKLTPEEATRRAKEFFGANGYGLKLVEETPTSACFEGGGGRIEIVACKEDKGTSIDLISQEWDYQVREFIKKVS
jgi:hypothetical protein